VLGSVSRGHGPDGRYRDHYSGVTLQRWARKIKLWQREQRQVFVYFDNDQKSYVAIGKYFRSSPPRSLSAVRPKCGTSMWVVRIEPNSPNHDRRTFECPQCENVVSEIVKYR